MLGKLLKYEFSATARQFLPLYGVLVVASVIVRLFGGWNDGIFSGMESSGPALPFFISSMVYFGLLVAVGVLTLIVMIQRFQHNLLGDEGYLMFTLPVRSWTLIVSKLITTLIWAFISGLIMLLTFAILSSGTDFVHEFSRLISELWAAFTQGLDMNASLLIVEIVLSGIVSAISGILMVYAAISLGHLFSRNRSLASFGAFLALSVITSTISMLISDILHGSISWEQNNAAFLHAVNLEDLISGLLFSAAFFFLTNYILSKRLNLE